VFMTILGIAVGGTQPTLSGVTLFLLEEVVGGALLGLMMGYATFLLLRSINEYQVEILLTLALTTGSYALAESIHVSAPIAIVVAGLIIGNHGRSMARGDKIRAHLDTFWELADDILNAVLFVLIGLEMIALSFHWSHMGLAVVAIVITLLARLVSIGVPIKIMSSHRKFSNGVVPIITWGGLRGGISIALALSLPLSQEREVILFVTYVIVIWSILGQGLTLGALVKWFSKS